MAVLEAFMYDLAFLEQELHASDLRDLVGRGETLFFGRLSTYTSGGQLLVLYSTLFWATYLNAPEFVDGLWDYGGRNHRSAWFPAL